MSETISLAIENFPEQHPCMHPELLVEAARSALEHEHVSPAQFAAYNKDEEFETTIQFNPADPRTKDTLERERIVEQGAIVLAGLLLTHFHGKQITRVVGRGSRVDYFVGDAAGHQQSILEVGGTDGGSFGHLRTTKREQMEQSPYRKAPHWKIGYVAATRFSPAAKTGIEVIAANRSPEATDGPAS